MTFETWILFLITETLMSLTPGPAVLLIMSHGLASKKTETLIASLGILSGNTVYFLLSATGLGALILASNEVFNIIKWAGAAYLVWLGISAFLGKGNSLQVKQSEQTGKLKAFRSGFILQLANPKALIFFVAFLPQFIDPTLPIAPQILILAVTSVFAEFLVLLFYGTTARKARQWVKKPGYMKWFDRISGGMLIGAGTSIAVLRRSAL